MQETWNQAWWMISDGHDFGHTRQSMNTKKSWVTFSHDFHPKELWECNETNIIIYLGCIILLSIHVSSHGHWTVTWTIDLILDWFYFRSFCRSSKFFFRKMITMQTTSQHPSVSIRHLVDSLSENNYDSPTNAFDVKRKSIGWWSCDASMNYFLLKFRFQRFRNRIRVVFFCAYHEFEWKIK